MDRINRAEKEGFTMEDKCLAGGFYTCAVGERFGLGKTGTRKLSKKYTARKYSRLIALGYSFFEFVDRNCIKEAKIIYNEIQKIKV